jgi:hypothetical protein
MAHTYIISFLKRRNEFSGSKTFGRTAYYASLSATKENVDSCKQQVFDWDHSVFRSNHATFKGGGSFDDDRGSR